MFFIFSIITILLYTFIPEKSTLYVYFTIQYVYFTIQFIPISLCILHGSVPMNMMDKKRFLGIQNSSGAKGLSGHTTVK